MRAKNNGPGLVVLFGSGEMSPTGRKIHETVFKQAGLAAPVRVGILETPTGFEVNAIHGWPERMEQFLIRSLANYKPEITRIRAWRKDGERSTNDPLLVDGIGLMDYLYCGAGSPSYTIRHLGKTRAWNRLITAWARGMTLCLGSATAVAISRFALPVYEIFKAGADLHWLRGLNFFQSVIPNLVIIPHWNNQEGEDFDTSRCWMGKERFERMRQLLPQNATILGIDEQTACVVDFREETLAVLGAGTAHVIKRGIETLLPAGTILPIAQVRS